MAVGEYISVSSQRDTEQADIEKEEEEQATEVGRVRELDELTQIYMDRGLDFHLARQVCTSIASTHSCKSFKDRVAQLAAKKHGMTCKAVLPIPF